MTAPVHYHKCIKCHRLFPCRRLIMRCKCGRDDRCLGDRKWCPHVEYIYQNICATGPERRSICEPCFYKMCFPARPTISDEEMQRRVLSQRVA